MRFNLLTILLISFISYNTYAQPSNDGCENPIEITNLSNWCSNFGAYTNVAATDSGFSPATCMTNGNNDVWFSFVAIAPDVTITVVGNNSGSSGGTLNQPEIALYSNNCGGTLSQFGCVSNSTSSNIAELYEGGLTVGQTYLIRIDGRNSNTGTFQLCLNNYNPPVLPGGDCATRSYLCDKSSFTVPSISGVGSNGNELNGTCLGGESNSTWFAWTCSVSGTLTFTLTPTNISDDLDFVIYELPNGVNDCSGKSPRMCMAAGESFYPSPCMGPTGLAETSNDTQEDPGCGGGNDNWLAPLNMTAGTSYALAVNNFTATGNGFSIEFGGTGEFLGPEAAFTTDDADNIICMGNSVTFTDASTSEVGTIVGQAWNFGVGASPTTATGPGPHTVTYNSVGVKSVTLTVENSYGCILTEITDIQVDPCCDTDNAMQIDGITNELLCYDDPIGMIDVSVTSPFNIQSYEWNTGAMTEDVNGLTGGDYTITITNQFCEQEATFNIPSPPPFSFDTVMTLATCGGGTDGSLTLNVSGGTPPYLFDWNNGNGFTTNNVYDNIPIGFYDVTVRDANNCESMLTLEVNELELELDPTVEAVTPPSCFGYDDGSIQLVIANGQPPFLFDWNDGNGFVSTNTMEGIVNATFFVDVMDANGCMGAGQFELVVEPPPLLETDLEEVPVSCFGESDGQIVPTVTGGTYPYNFNWNVGQNDSIAIGLPAGEYYVTVLDNNNCPAYDTIEVTQPAELGINSIDVIDVLCFGDETGSLTAHAWGGNPPYMFSIDGENFQSDSTFLEIPSGSYNVMVMDMMGCSFSAPAFINQPTELIADAGPDLTNVLGYSVQIQGGHFPPFKPVSIEWSPSESLSCTDCFMPLASPVVNTTYYLTITDNTGCVDIDSMTVFVDDQRPIYIPNAFSPNGDGFNDVFTAYSGPAASRIKSLKVFSRWGEMVYNGQDLDIFDYNGQGWDGKFRGEYMNASVFVYLIEIEFIDGFVGLYQGDVTLLR